MPPPPGIEPAPIAGRGTDTTALSKYLRIGVINNIFSFQKCFYSPTEATQSLDESQLDSYRAEHSINLYGRGSKQFRPVLEFKDVNLDERVRRERK